MIGMRRRAMQAVLIAAVLPMLGGCASFNLPSFNGPFASSASPPPPPPAPPALPPSLRAEDIVGRWGYSSYHREQDRARTEVAAREQCTQPYVINRSPSGGVLMLGHDSPKVEDMNIKGSAEGRTYIGPSPDPAGADDREVVNFDGRVLLLKWVDPEVAGRYGIMVLVRCPPEGSGRTARVRRPPPPPPPQ
jgi:hypothetical protein